MLRFPNSLYFRVHLTGRVPSPWANILTAIFYLYYILTTHGLRLSI